MSKWAAANCESNIRAILGQARGTEVGPMWMTAYQIATRFEALFPNDAATIGMPVGGEGKGPNGMAQYLAGELVNGILRRGSIKGIELAYLDLGGVASLEFNANGDRIAAAALANRTLAIFRLTDGSGD